MDQVDGGVENVLWRWLGRSMFAPTRFSVRGETT
jgi:hypothetical protein